MTVPAGSRWGARLLTLLATLTISLGAVSAARAASPSLLGGEQVDGHNTALNAVSCASAGYCVTGGQDLIVQDHAVRTDLTTTLSSATLELSAISCAPGTTICALMDDTGGAYTMSNGTVGSRTSLSPGNQFDDVSCASASFCVAIDELGNTFTYDGSSWSSATPHGTLTTGLTGLQVSCVSSSFCVAAVPAGGASPDEDYFTLNGSIWTARGAMESTGATLGGLSCTSPTFCVATDTQGFGLRFNGLTWTKTAVVQGAGVGTDDRLHVSCVGAFCLASSEQAANTYTTSDGSTWVTGTNIKAANGGFGGGGPTSCASATMCVIVDQGGNGYTYASPDTPSPGPTLAGSPVVGTAITLTPGTVANPEASVTDTFQRCLPTCTTLSGTSYAVVASDVGATFKDSEMTGVGLDVEGPFTATSIGPIAQPMGPPSVGPGPGRSPSGGTATVGSTSTSGTNATVVVSCPAAQSGGCKVSVTLTVIETRSGKKVIAVTAAKHKKPTKTRRTVTVGSVTTTVAAGAQRTLTVSLNRAGKTLLARHHSLKVRLSVSSGAKSLATRTIGFTAPRKKTRKK